MLSLSLSALLNQSHSKDIFEILSIKCYVFNNLQLVIKEKIVSYVATKSMVGKNIVFGKEIFVGPQSEGLM